MNLIFLLTFNCSNSSSTVCIWRKTSYPFLTVTTLSNRTLWVALLKFNTWKHINRARQRGDEKFGKTLEGVPLFLWKHFAFISINLVFPAVFWCRIFVYKQKITNSQVFKSFFPRKNILVGLIDVFDNLLVSWLHWSTTKKTANVEISKRGWSIINVKGVLKENLWNWNEK